MVDQDALKELLNMKPIQLRLLILLLILGGAVGCDQTSKTLARRELRHVGSISLPGGFGELRLAENPGSFLSFGDSLPAPLRIALLTIGVGAGLLGLVTYLVRSNRLGFYSFIGFALVWAGGMSNLIDRVTRKGFVTDFVFLRVGPFHTGVFNAADVIIMAGLAVLVCDLWKQRHSRTPQPTS